MKQLLLIPFLIASLNLFAQQNEKEQKIRELMEVSGSANISQQVFNSLIDQVKTMSPEVPDEFWEEAKSLVDANSIIELLIPIYDKYYSLEDIKGLIEFYETPLGKKTVELLPLISQESMTVGQEWGEEMAQKLIESLEAKGYW